MSTSTMMSSVNAVAHAVTTWATPIPVSRSQRRSSVMVCKFTTSSWSGTDNIPVSLIGAIAVASAVRPLQNAIHAEESERSLILKRHDGALKRGREPGVHRHRSAAGRRSAGRRSAGRRSSSQET
ncbi:MAG: hypothetical protein EXR69_12580 [Myxococcales bacterium]|nr:hypothetical protein [Myxococcales bacterium]